MPGGRNGSDGEDSFASVRIRGGLASLEVIAPLSPQVASNLRRNGGDELAMFFLGRLLRMVCVQVWPEVPTFEPVPQDHAHRQDAVVGSRGLRLT